MLHRAKACGCEKEIGMSKAHQPQVCEHNNRYEYVRGLSRSTQQSVSPTPVAKGGLKRTGRRRETAAESTARFHFNEMCRTRPCFLFWQQRPGHKCDGPRDAHHLIPKDFIRQRCSDWPEKDLLRVLYNPLIGAPLCRRAHNEIEARNEFIYWDELSDECLEYVSTLPDFFMLRLELESPKRKVSA